MAGEARAYRGAADRADIRYRRVDRCAIPAQASAGALLPAAVGTARLVVRAGATRRPGRDTKEWDRWRTTRVTRSLPCWLRGRRWPAATPGLATCRITCRPITGTSRTRISLRPRRRGAPRSP